MHRRDFLATIPLVALAPGLALAKDGEAPNPTADGKAPALFLSPPVVQHAGLDGFTVSIEISSLATVRVEWGWSADKLTEIALATHHGLVDAEDSCQVIRVQFAKSANAGATVHYRVVGQTLHYVSAHNLIRGVPTATGTRALVLPHAGQERTTLAIINDTHENTATINALVGRIATVNPDMLVWNGDTCNDFNGNDNPEAILLRPGARGAAASDGGWADTRPLLYVNGNHDVRGVKARRVGKIMAAGPEPDLPYNRAMRIGPLALISLDTGEDKPDAFPGFFGTAAFEPYRKRQALWLQKALARPEIASAPYKIACCHIPLRGLRGHPDGSSMKGFAYYCGHAAKHWLPHLAQAGVRAVVSGHMHQWRIDKPSGKQPAQVVGGGPKPNTATLIVVDCDESKLDIRVETLSGRVLNRISW